MALHPCPPSIFVAGKWRYDLNSLNFQRLDKFLVRAVNCYQRVWEAAAATRPSLFDLTGLYEPESLQSHTEKRVHFIKMEEAGCYTSPDEAAGDI
jgi:hypothetical protein